VPNRLPKVATAAVIVAILLAATFLLSARTHIFLAAFAAVPIGSAISILRRRAWGAYGLALVELAQSVITPFALTETLAIRQLAINIAVGVLISALFFFAGRSLTAVGAQRGWRWPWIVLACLFTLPFFFFGAFTIPTAAMENTLLIGDYVVVRKLPRPTPQRNDLLVFRFPGDPKQVFVKRLIGVPGDRIQLKSDVVYRNGSALNEPYAVHKFTLPRRDSGNYPVDPATLPSVPGVEGARQMLRSDVVNGEIVVPPGKYFVLGDNRDNSLDSRYWGFVSTSEIIGKALLIYDSEGPDKRVRWNRLFKRL
jgi:signal peptidase I